MAANSLLEPVWSQFAAACRPRSIESLGNHGGYSGARLWRAQTKLGQLCLRAWPPEQPSPQQLNFIHHVLLHVHEQGLSFVPAPIRTLTGATFVEHDGYLWELAPWMNGVADFHVQPTRERMRAAMQALARFHLAAASSHSSDPVAPSPTLKRRFRELRDFLRGPAARELGRRVPDGRWPEMDARATRMLELVAAERDQLDAMLRQPLPSVPLQPVIRDIWHDHVLFDGDRVSAIIDFGAMSIDTVAVDVARLLGSLADGDADAWRDGIDAYEEVRPLVGRQLDLLTTLDRSGIVAGGLIWLRWHYLENRTFENRAGVLARVDHFLNRLETNGDLPFRPHRRASRISVTA
jgi:homoserine kinase type II